MKTGLPTLALVLAASLPVFAQDHAKLKLDLPNHVVIEQGMTCAFDKENMLRKNDSIASYSSEKTLGDMPSLCVDKDGKGNGLGFALRHDLRLCPLSSYEVTGQIYIEKMEGEGTILMAELLDQNREEFKSIEYKLPKPFALNQWVPFSFKFDSLRNTPYLRMWVIADKPSPAKFYIDGMKLTQVSAPRALETPALGKADEGSSKTTETKVPAGSNYLTIKLATTGHPPGAGEELKVELLAEGKPSTVYLLKFTPVSGIRRKDDLTAGTWFEPTKKGFEDISFSRRTFDASLPKLDWSKELDIPAGAETVRITSPSGGGFKIQNLTVEMRKDRTPIPPTESHADTAMQQVD